MKKIHVAKLINPDYQLVDQSTMQDDSDEDVEMSEPGVASAPEKKKIDMRKSNDMLMRMSIVRYLNRVLRKC